MIGCNRQISAGEVGSGHTLFPVARMKRLVLLAIVVLGSMSCHCGGSQLPVNASPLRLTDSRKGDEIQTCLVIPRYGTSAGVSTGAGHGPTRMKHTVFIARPFFYRASEPFKPYQGEASGVFLVGAWVGTAVWIDGVTVIAPGYSSQWIWDLWSRDPLSGVVMEPLAPEAAVEELQNLSALLEGDRIEGRNRMHWGYAGEGPIEVRFSDSERSEVLAFLKSSADALRSDTLGEVLNEGGK